MHSFVCIAGFPEVIRNHMPWATVKSMSSFGMSSDLHRSAIADRAKDGLLALFVSSAHLHLL